MKSWEEERFKCVGDVVRCGGGVFCEGVKGVMEVGVEKWGWSLDRMKRMNRIGSWD